MDKMIPPWVSVKDEFEWDGSWRDIYVLDTGPEEWRCFLELVYQNPSEINFYIDGEMTDQPPPVSIAEALSIREKAAPTLFVNKSGLIFACHFFTDEEIELDIDPRQVDCEDRYKILIGFCQDLSLAVSRKVIVTPENIQETPIFQICGNSVNYIPAYNIGRT
jgi:hypothetical protein